MTSALEMIAYAGIGAGLVAFFGCAVSRSNKDLLIYASEEDLAIWPVERLHLVSLMIEQRLRGRFFPPGRNTRKRLEGRLKSISLLLAAHEEPAEGTILAHILTHLDPSGTGLLPGGDELPDEEPARLNDVRWSPGAFEGSMARHFGISPEEENIQAIAGLIVRTIENGFNEAHFEELCTLLSSGKLISSIDGVLQEVRSSGLSGNEVRELGERLARTGHHREPVKLGISLLGLLAGNPGRDLLLTLGRHEEFTLYSAVAIANVEPAASRDRTLLVLARSVEGWGRIHAVERLAGSLDPEVRDWMLRVGYRNSIMIEYTACIAATTGKLADALNNPAADDQLVDAAGEILGALAIGGPAEDMDDYTDAPLAIERFLGLVEGRHFPGLSHYGAVKDISRYLNREKEDRNAAGWTAGLREELAGRCAWIIQLPGWASLAREGLTSEDNKEFYHAERTARDLGIDTFPAHWARLLADPLNGNWFAVLRDTNARRLPEVLGVARRSLPLNELGSGPADEGASRELFRAHTILDFIVAKLADFPGQGWDLVETCLRSPLARNRNIAIKTLEAWTPEAWPPTARTVLERTHATEPDESVRQRLNDLIE